MALGLGKHRQSHGGHVGEVCSFRLVASPTLHRLADSRVARKIPKCIDIRAMLPRDEFPRRVVLAEHLMNLERQLLNA